jgi:hypothetical protein
VITKVTTGGALGKNKVNAGRFYADIGPRSMLTQEAGKMGVYDDYLIGSLFEQRRKKAQCGTATAHSHYVISESINNRLLPYLNIKGAATVYSKTNSLPISQVRDESGYGQTIQTGHKIHSAYRNDLGAIFFRGQMANLLPAVINGRTFLPKAQIGIDF